MEPFLVIGITLLLAFVLGEVAEALGEPPLLGQILAGILLGPHLVDLIHPGGEFATLAAIGAALLLFDAGYEDVELDRLLEYRFSATAIALMGMTVPFSAGFLLGIAFGYGTMPSVFLGLALSVTSIAITVGTLVNMDRMNTPYGVRILAAAVLDDILGLLGFSFLLLAVSGGVGTPVEIGLRLLKVAAFFVAAFLFHRYLLRRVSNRLQCTTQRGGMFLGIMALLFVFGYGAEYAGLDVTIGAFVAGLIIGEDRRLGGLEVREGVTGVAYGVFIPLFFASVGARIDLGVLTDPTPLLAFVVVVGVAAKILGGYLGSYLSGRDRAESLVVGIGMVPRTGIELVIVTAALSAGVIDQNIFSAVLGLVVVSVLITPSLLKRAVERYEGRASA